MTAKRRFALPLFLSLAAGLAVSCGAPSLPSGPAEPAPELGTQRYKAELEKKWARVKKAARQRDTEGKLELYQAFLAEFPVDNPYAQKARNRIERWEKKLAAEQEARAEAESRARKRAEARARQEEIARAKRRAESTTGSTAAELEAWRSFVEEYSDKDNPYLGTAKRKIGALERKLKKEERRARLEAEKKKKAAAEKKGPAGVEWLRIEGGSFRMGSASGDDDEKPVHAVDVPTFHIARTEVTVEQWEACRRAGECSSSHVGDKGDHENCNLGYGDRGDHPVNCIDWHGAGQVCEWLGGRLPSEAEWEYAARSGGRDQRYPWGDREASCAYAVMKDGGRGCGKNRTWPVCEKPRGNTSQGVCDMAGNVWEWVKDVYHDSYSGAPADGGAWTSGDDNGRVLRGGSWHVGYPDYLRAAYRSRSSPTYGGDSYGVGVRCARSSR